MSRLAPIDPDADFIDMEDAIHTAADMASVVYHMVSDLFSRAATDGRYRIDEDDGHRLFFLAGLAIDMARRVEDAYRIAHANHYAAKTEGAS